MIPARLDAEHEHPRLDEAAARHEGLEDVDRHHADDHADPEREHDDDEVLRAQAEHVLRERRAQDAEDADDRRGDPQVEQRPAHDRVGADVGDPFAELLDERADRLLGLVQRGVVRHRAGRRRRQRPAEAAGDQVEDRHERR